VMISNFDALLDDPPLNRPIAFLELVSVVELISHTL